MTNEDILSGIYEESKLTSSYSDFDLSRNTHVVKYNLHMKIIVIEISFSVALLILYIVLINEYKTFENLISLHSIQNFLSILFIN